MSAMARDDTPLGFKGRLAATLASRQDRDGLQASIARHFEISIQAVYQWFSLDEKSRPDMCKIVDLARLLDVSVIWLLCGEGPKEPEPMSPQEYELLRKYRRLSVEGKSAVAALMDGFLISPAPFRVGEAR